jgi:hypothetical protein
MDVNKDQCVEPLLQTMETEQGGVRVYEIARKLILAGILAVTCAACAMQPNAWTTTWTSFTRTNTSTETRDQDWQECHDRYVNKYSYLVTGWFATETANHQPQIRACMEGKGYALKDRQ